MNIAIIGAGAAGSLFAGYLANAGYKIIITDSDSKKIDAIAKKGIKVLSPDRKEILNTFLYEAVTIENLSLSKNFKNCQYYIFCVKSFSTQAAAESIFKFSKSDSIAVTFQNGAGNIENISSVFDIKNIAAGTTTEGATQLEPGIIIHGGKGKTGIGMIKNNLEDKEKIIPLINAFEKSGFKSFYSDNPKKMIWEKLAVNASINSITAILKNKNGIIGENSYLKNLVKIITEEVCIAAELDGIKLDPDTTYNTVLDVAKNTSANKSSMLQDILAGKKTEIENICGFISQTAEDKDKIVKANQSLFLLVKALENKS